MKLVDILDFNFDSDLIDGQRATEQFMCTSVTGPNVGELLVRNRLIDMARHRRRLEVRAGEMHPELGLLESWRGGALTARQAPYQYGAAVVVIAFDEQARQRRLKTRCVFGGGATTRYDPSLFPSRRSSFFDCNVLANATAFPSTTRMA